MSDVFKERIPCTSGFDVSCNVLEVKVYYDLGGVSWATGDRNKRGYYLSVSPLQVSSNTVMYQGFSGMYYFLNEVARQSKKGEEIALKLAQESKKMVIDAVCKKHGIELKEAVNV